VCRVEAVEYTPSTDHVPEARHWLQERLRRWELDSLLPDASLLVTELVTNAVVHAQSSFHVVATVADGVLEVGVSDQNPRRPVLRSQHPDFGSGSGQEQRLVPAEGGRGIALIDDIAEDWGVAMLANGKQVWFRLSVQAGWSYRTACPCQGDQLERIRLESGRFAVAVSGDWDNS
jgi:anti-sigma regulatory factor (Ser/Thr protein kinase)